MLPIKDFKAIIQSTPLVSIDFIVKNNNKILLGKRVNKPACGYYFTLGGRVYKNESIHNAQKRIFKSELGFELNQDTKFIGIFEHFYHDSFVDDNISTHYINLGYELELFPIETLPIEQHDSYKWFTLEELFSSNEVHKYVKDYFKVGDNN